MSCILRETVPKNVLLLSATSLSCNSKAFSNCNVRWHCCKMQSRGTTKTFDNYLSQSFRKMFLQWSKFHAHPATRRRGDTLTTSLCTSHRCRRYVSNEILNDVLPRRLSGTSVQHLMECRDDVSRGRHKDVPSVRQTSLKWNTQQRLSGKSPKGISSTYLRRPISTSLRCLL